MAYACTFPIINIYKIYIHIYIYIYVNIQIYIYKIYKIIQENGKVRNTFAF